MQSSVSQSAPVVAAASRDQRAQFIARTYGHLFGAIALFMALEVVWFATPLAQVMFKFLLTGGIGLLLFMGAFVGVSYLANKWALEGGSAAKQYAGLGLYTVFESIVFAPVLAMAAVMGAQGQPILGRAVLITLTLFGSLTGVVFITRKDFSFMRSALMFAGFAAFGLVILSVIFGFTLGIAFSYAIVALACGYILYHTSNIMLHYRTNQHVAASLALFSSVMLLFMYVLRVLMSRRR